MCGFPSIVTCVSLVRGLAEEVSDFLVNMTEEVDVGRTTRRASVLDQVLLEYWL